MGLFLVELKDNEKMTLIGGRQGKAVVSAGSAADAKSVAAAIVSGDSNAAWQNATVTDLSTAIANYALLSVRAQVITASPVINVKQTMPSGNVVATVAIDAGGTGYSVNDICTVSTGTKTRAATVRVTSESGGVVDGIELVDCGDTYTVDPTLAGVATTGGGGTGLTLDVTMIANDYKNLMGALVTALNANAAISGAAIDFGTGTNGTLTVTGAGDSLGDQTIVVKMFFESDADETAIAGLIGALTHEGSAGAATSALLAASATVLPGMIANF